MTKKDYIAIATAINTTLWEPKSDPATVSALATRLAAVFEADNPRFDRIRFFEAAFIERG